MGRSSRVDFTDRRSYFTHRLWRACGAADTVARVADRVAIQARLGRAVRGVRLRQGLTQEQVSAGSGLHPTYISDIERGARNPSWEAITRLADGLGVPLAEIAARYDAGDDDPLTRVPPE